MLQMARIERRDLKNKKNMPTCTQQCVEKEYRQNWIRSGMNGWEDVQLTEYEGTKEMAG